MSIWEQLTKWLDCSNMYTLWDLLYWHKPLQCNSWRILLHSSWVCDNASILSVSSTASLWSVSRSELDLDKIVVTDSGVLWLIGNGRQRFFLSKFFCTVLCMCTWPGDSGLMMGACNFSLTFLPLSSCMFIMEESCSFASVPIPWLLGLSSFDLLYWALVTSGILTSKALA